MKKKIMKQLEVMFYYVTKLQRIEELLNEIIQNTKKVELTPIRYSEGFSLDGVHSTSNSIEPKIKSGIVGEAGPELNFPKRYPVKDKFNNKVIAVFYNENAAREYVASCKCYYMDEVD